MGVVYPEAMPPEFPATAITGLLPQDDLGMVPPDGKVTPPLSFTLELAKGKGKPTKATIGAAVGGTDASRSAATRSPA